MSLKCILLGASGFLGPHIISKIKSTDPIVHLECSPGSESVDLSNYSELEQFLKLHITSDCTIIINASRPSYAVSPKDDPAKMQQNSSIMANVAKCILDNKLPIQRIIYMSTVDVYGSQVGKKLDETAQLMPNSFYAISKITAERILQLLALKIKCKWIILRSSQIYGFGDNSSKFIPVSINLARNSSKIIVKNGGDTLRDFVWVEDIASIVQKCIFWDYSGIFNICPNAPVSIKDVAIMLQSLITKHVGKINIEYHSEPRSGDNGYTLYQNNLLLSHLNYKFCNFENEMSRYIDKIFSQSDELND